MSVVHWAAIARALLKQGADGTAVDVAEGNGSVRVVALVMAERLLW